MSDASIIISGTRLTKSYRSGLLGRDIIPVLQDVDIRIRRGETYSLIGESGSGKTTLGKILLQLLSPDSGEILFNGKEISVNHPDAQLRRKIQIIPQHPEEALNPRWRISRSVLEPFVIYPDLCTRNKGEILRSLLVMTGFNPEYADRYPHQLSGGELQRAIIARTLAMKPEFIVCDEPTSMLDVSVQASIIRLLKNIQRESGVTLLFITHDIRLAEFFGDRIGVMYNGKIIEEGSDILSSPRHPYTRSLVNTVNHLSP